MAQVARGERERERRKNLLNLILIYTPCYILRKFYIIFKRIILNS